MITSTLPMIGLCAYSGTGKTTLMTQLVPLLKAAGLRLSVIKHAHHNLELDQPGKDSYKIRQAGADQMILASRRLLASLQDRHAAEDASLEEALPLVDTTQTDLILVEGFKHEAFPKIELHRPALQKPLLYPDDPNIIAIASDAPFNAPSDARHVPQLDLNKPASLAQFILDNVLKPASPNTQIRSAVSCADARDPESLSLSEASQGIMAQVQPLTSYSRRPVRDSLGQVLAKAVTSPINVPSHTNSAMDGYALSGADLPQDTVKTYRLIETLHAGQSTHTHCQTGECIRIMTGAPMPAGTDTVVMQEHSELKADGNVRLGTGHRAGQNVRQAGEDIAQGQVVLSAGRRLTSADIGLFASLGLAEVYVYRPPRVAFFSTGDELRSLGETLPTGCVYDSNRYTLYAMLTQLGVEIIDMGVIPDEPDALKTAFQTAAQNADVVISSGGVSVGEADHTKFILDELGEIGFWKIAIKPGRPLAFGTLGDTLFFGLPGNPVAVMVTFQQLVQPALLKLAGEPDYQPLILPAICTEKLRKKTGRTEFLRAILSTQADGRLTVERAGQQGSGILTSMSRANSFIILDEANDGVQPGDVVNVQPFGRWGGF